MNRFRWKKSAAEESESRSRRPKDTPYKQQRMWAWEPVYGPKTSSIVFLALGVMLCSFGTFWLVVNTKVREIRLDYTRCHQIQSYDQLEVMPGRYVRKHTSGKSAGQPLERWKRANKTLTFDGVTKNYTLCTIEFYLPADLEPPVFFYYHLTNFYQNHRNYGTSRHNGQLKGESASLQSVKDSACKDVSVVKSRDGSQEKPIYPCGLIAASYFNDTFSYPRRHRVDANGMIGQSTAYNMSQEGIALSNDKSLYKPSTYNITATADDSIDSPVVPPPSWAERYPNGYHKGNMFDPSVDESFMVWMRTASSPRFAKLAMRNDNDTMEKGLYRLDIFSRRFPPLKHISIIC
ncbi:hypothetical protein BHE90_004474 [Fusarium euwallaceae]|uniref:Uncharacterized protein n=1 Tax=Fusarium euwallaceae TaxID=1147111 RepID=A0A430LZD1_9HYPO|nr:hypothetical protein BHE90_004474 [Fusarium euwallaceae]